MSISSEPSFGVALPFFEHQNDFESVLHFAGEADTLGFDSLWVGDHIVLGPAGTRNWYDAPVLLAGLASIAPRVRLGTDVLVVPYRHPIATAKALATLDLVSRGRLIIGVGVGNSPSESATLGTDYPCRGPVTDEYLQVWRSVWSDGPTEFHGDHVSVFAPELLPKPAQRPPPIWIGGNSRRARRRAALLGDGWHPLALQPRDYADGIADLRRLTETLSRPMPTLSYSGYFGMVGPEISDPSRIPLTGSVEQVRDDIGQLSELGVTHFVFRLGGPELSAQAVAEQLHLVGAEILPS